MNTSRIEIYNNQNEKPRVIQPPAGYEFTGGISPIPHIMPYPHYLFETRPLPTAKEQRAEKLINYLHRFHSNTPVAAKCADCNNNASAIEAIYTEYLKEPE